MVKSDDFLLARGPLSCIGGWQHLCACCWGRDKQAERGRAVSSHGWDSWGAAVVPVKHKSG